MRCECGEWGSVGEVGVGLGVSVCVEDGGVWV